MMRAKSFTLIEILLASTIFAMVIATSMASFLMVKNSNYRSDDLRTAQGCARQLRDFVSAFARSASPKGDRLEGIKINGGNYSLVPLTENTSSSVTDFVGFAVHSDENNFNIIYKKQLSDGSYTFETSASPVAINSTGIYSFQSSDRAVITSVCSAFTDSDTEGYFSDYSFATPFKVYFEKHSPDYTSNNQSDKIAVVNFRDVVYRSLDKDGVTLSQKYSIDKKSFGNVDLTVTSSARPLW